MKQILFSPLTLALLLGWAYLQTLAPGVYGFDSAELATGASTLGIVHPTGYPLYLLLAHVFSWLPIGSVAYRLNLFSALFGILTVLTLFQLEMQLKIRRAAAWTGAALFGLSYYFWHLSIVTEVYTMHTFFLAFCLLLLFKWRESGGEFLLYGFAFVYGLSLANHVSGILFLPGFLWLMISSPFWRWRSFQRILKMAGLFTLGLTPYLYLPIRAGMNLQLNYVAEYYKINLQTLPGLWWMISGQAYSLFSFGYSLGELPDELFRFGAYLWRNFLGAGVVIGFIGLYSILKQQSKVALGSALIFAANMIFFINYRVIDKDTMFLPAFLIWAIYFSFGIDYFLKVAEKSVYLFSPFFKNGFKSVFLVGPVLVALVFNWSWVDLSNQNGPELFGEHVFSTVEENALIIAPWSSAVVLEYYQSVDGIRPDVQIYNRARSQVAQYYLMWDQKIPQYEIIESINQNEFLFIANEIRYREVYIVGYDPKYTDIYEFNPSGSLFHLKPISESGNSENIGSEN